MIYIYGLCCPETKQIRYIGKTIRPKGRLRDHINDKSKTHKVNWITGLKNKGLIPEMVILETLKDGSNWEESEIKWIKQGNDNGWNLVNSTSGGDGVPDLTGESLEKKLTAWIGRNHTEETKKKISKNRKGKGKHTKERNEYMRKIMTGRHNDWGDKVGLSIMKFNEQKQKEVLQLIKNGIKIKDIADKYGVHRTTISKIKMGKYPK